MKNQTGLKSIFLLAANVEDSKLQQNSAPSASFHSWHHYIIIDIFIILFSSIHFLHFKISCSYEKQPSTRGFPVQLVSVTSDGPSAMMDEATSQQRRPHPKHASVWWHHLHPDWQHLLTANTRGLLFSYAALSTRQFVPTRFFRTHTYRSLKYSSKVTEGDSLARNTLVKIPLCVL